MTKNQKREKKLESDEKEIKLKVSFDWRNLKMYVIPEYWDDDVKEHIKEMFPECEVKCHDETEHVGKKRSFCG